MYEYFCLNIYVCTMQVPDAFGSQKRALDLRGLELQMVMNFYVGAGIHTWVLCMNKVSFAQKQVF